MCGLFGKQQQKFQSQFKSRLVCLHLRVSSMTKGVDPGGLRWRLQLVTRVPLFNLMTDYVHQPDPQLL